ncbi:MAG: adenylyl-sulfate kinase [Lachnospiraceae bacterium]|nr:adenylyl-sulfate kinase [Lachnospiraceae bacterium]
MANGRVYWITGLSNSGKTTIGTALYYDLRRQGQDVIILDGDLMKQIASGSISAGYEEADRLIRAKRYSLMAKLLADQGTWVIVCAIAMFDEIRDWNRRNIRGYVEVFLDVPKEILKSRDRKGLYKDEMYAQLPKKPDIIIANDGDEPIRDIIKRIELLEPSNEDDYDRDRKYWNQFYMRLKSGLDKPSDFAVEVNKRLRPHSHIMELGCGNGRDSLFFLSQGHSVIAVDGSDAAIDRLNGLTATDKNALFVCDDFVKCHALYQMQYDCVYSRFTLHAIDDDQEDELLMNTREALNSGGMLCIEARTVHDEIYGIGEKVGHNAYKYNDHYRRFIDAEEFRAKIEKMGFEIIECVESQGFSKTEDSDPVLMRCVATIKGSCLSIKSN